MDSKVEEHLKKYCESNGWSTNMDTIKEVLIEADSVWTGNESERRWWIDLTKVVEIDGVLIGFDYAHSTGDQSLSDLGWEFNFDSIKEYSSREETRVVKIYEPMSE